MDHGPATFFTKEKNFTLNKLNSVVILDKINYQFTYTNSSTERLKLKTLTKTTPSGTQSTYSLNYFPNHLPDIIQDTMTTSDSITVKISHTISAKSSLKMQFLLTSR